MGAEAAATATSTEARPGTQVHAMEEVAGVAAAV